MSENSGDTVQARPADVDEEVVRRRVEDERTAAARRLGLPPPPRHVRRAAERTFTREQRASTTLLFGGLTGKHERLIEGALRGLGYRGAALPCPDVAAFRAGREHGNGGQCSPTYFTVGSLLRHLDGLVAAGLPRDEVLDRFVFVTGGACGPCRFGMYAEEYRHALRSAGYSEFRVIVFDKTAGLRQSGADAGLELDVRFFLALVLAMLVGDLFHDLAFSIRPFEGVPGETDRVIAECVEDLYALLSRPGFIPRRGRVLGRSGSGAAARAEQAAVILGMLTNGTVVERLRAARQRLGAVTVDRTRVKPVVKITGEFWAQTTEGDGNFGVFRFLEGEGAQVVVEPLATWMTYLLHQHKQRRRDAAEAAGGLGGGLRGAVTAAPLSVAEVILAAQWRRLRAALGHLPHPLADQDELARLAAPWYNPRASGGEGHLEVAKTLHAARHGLAHMVLSVKPFGCLPSTQSDGVQSAVAAQLPNLIFLPVETSGEGEINAHSRVQMALADARTACRRELDQVLDTTGLTLDEVREYVAAHPTLASAATPVPRRAGVAGTAANLAAHVADLSAGRARLRRASRP